MELLAQSLFEQKSQQNWQKQYRAYLQNEEVEDLWSKYRIDRKTSDLPNTVVQAVQFYLAEVEDKDFGGVQLFKIPLIDTDLDNKDKKEESIYLVKVSTDGDDGWVELYDTEGFFLSAGRTYIELVAWGSLPEIRNYVYSSGFPKSMADRSERTLWGK